MTETTALPQNNAPAPSAPSTQLNADDFLAIMIARLENKYTSEEIEHKVDAILAKVDYDNPSSIGDAMLPRVPNDAAMGGMSSLYEQIEKAGESFSKVQTFIEDQQKAITQKGQAQTVADFVPAPAPKRGGFWSWGSNAKDVTSKKDEPAQPVTRAASIYDLKRDIKAQIVACNNLVEVEFPQLQRAIGFAVDIDRQNIENMAINLIALRQLATNPATNAPTVDQEFIYALNQEEAAQMGSLNMMGGGLQSKLSLQLVIKTLEAHYRKAARQDLPNLLQGMDQQQMAEALSTAAGVIGNFKNMQLQQSEQALKQIQTLGDGTAALSDIEQANMQQLKDMIVSVFDQGMSVEAAAKKVVGKTIGAEKKPDEPVAAPPRLTGQARTDRLQAAQDEAEQIKITIQQLTDDGLEEMTADMKTQLTKLQQEIEQLTAPEMSADETAQRRAKLEQNIASLLQREKDFLQQGKGALATSMRSTISKLEKELQTITPIVEQQTQQPEAPTKIGDLAEAATVEAEQPAPAQPAPAIDTPQDNQPVVASSQEPVPVKPAPVKPATTIGGTIGGATESPQPK